ncbi:MAG: 2-C-methyl-D-erythritol 4-phosphate cytidylyltransferase [Acidimicrobiales bacterium]|jgi:2-C-methyl-D-erythritol 4-phosphate cytidylyltransferase|nr:2-C-methyl-D-erythritol 4-phosphate cytidylyltransferase [Acidimicrobiales bacterium]
MSVWTVVVAAGSSERFGADKQSADLVGRTVLERSVDAAGDSDGVVVVVAPAVVGEVTERLGGSVHAVVAGGATRSASVRAGLAVVPDVANVVLVHDGARPLASRDLFARVVAAVEAGADAVVPGVPVNDSLRRVDGAVDREGMMAVQTPQGFPAATLRAAHAGGADASDDATLVEAYGGSVVVVDGEGDNLKVTRPVDLLVARQVLEASGG